MKKNKERKQCSNFCRIGGLHIICIREEGHNGYCIAEVKCEYDDTNISVMWGTPKKLEIDDKYVIPF
jgi:hypothetical protein